MSGKQRQAILVGEKIPRTTEIWSKQVEKVVSSKRNGRAIADQTAIIFGDKVHTFGELNQQANCLARSLTQRIRQHMPDLRPHNEHVICTFGSTSDVHIIEWLAINKLGVSIMSFTPSTTGDKIQSTLYKSHPLCFLVDRNFQEALKDKNINTDDLLVLCFQDLMPQGQLSQDEENLDDSERIQVPGPEGYCLLSITSGSTGQPKLAGVTHKNWSNITAEHIARIDPTDDSVFLTHNVITTNSIESILPMMMGYPQVVLTYEHHRNPQYVAKIIDKYQVTSIPFLSPSFLSNLLLYVKVQKEDKSCHSLKWVECSAEALPVKVVKDFYEYFKGGTLLFNGWSMIETSDTTVIYEKLQRAADADIFSYEDQLSIGRPIPNVNVYVVDDELNLVNEGERGHLCVSGISIFKGYVQVNSPKVTKNHLFQDPEHDILLQSGDYARIINGHVIFEGRDFHHLRIRGYRVHIGEVEACVYKHIPAIEHARVRGIQSEGNQTELVCFCVPKPGKSVTGSDVISVCKENLEEYKVPMAVHIMDKIPVMPPNDKVDIKQLQEFHTNWKRGNVSMAKNQQKELDPFSDILFSCISEAFGISKYSLDPTSNIFDIGGTSVNLVWVWGKLKERGFNLQMADLFTSRTLSDIASLMGKM